MITIHGWSFDKTVWNKTVFKDFYHIELPGHGKSRLKETDLCKLTFRIEKFFEGGTVVGWSIGASVALLLAFYFPEKVEKLVLFAPSPAFCGISQNKTVCKNFLRRLQRNYEQTVNWFRKECGFKGDLSLPDKNKAFSLLESYMNLDIYKILPNIKIPTFIYVGERDRITTLKGAFEVFKALPRADLKVYPEKEHYIFGEDLKL